MMAGVPLSHHRRRTTLSFTTILLLSIVLVVRPAQSGSGVVVLSHDADGAALRDPCHQLVRDLVAQHPHVATYSPFQYKGLFQDPVGGSTPATSTAAPFPVDVAVVVPSSSGSPPAAHPSATARHHPYQPERMFIHEVRRAGTFAGRRPVVLQCVSASVTVANSTRVSVSRGVDLVWTSTTSPTSTHSSRRLPDAMALNPPRCRPSPLDVDGIVIAGLPLALSSVAHHVGLCHPGVPVHVAATTGPTLAAILQFSQLLSTSHPSVSSHGMEDGVSPPADLHQVAERQDPAGRDAARPATGIPIGSATVSAFFPSPEDLPFRPRRRPHVPRVAIIFYRPDELEGSTFEGGFVAAVHRLIAAGLYDVTWVNIARPQQPNYDDFDVVLVKSNWDWGVDTACRATLHSPPWKGLAKRVLLISGVAPPPEADDQLLFYDVLVHETQWYKPQIARHPRVQQAFGVDTTVFHPLPDRPPSRPWDVLFVGAFVPYKRPWLLATKHPGRRTLAVGRINMHPDMLAFEAESARIVRDLQAAGVTVQGPVPFHQLNALYNSASAVYIPSTTFGGGERAVLEARAAGAAVQVEPDNPKLQELATGPLWSHVDYAAALTSAIALALASGRGATAVDVYSAVLQPSGWVQVLGSVTPDFRVGTDGLLCVAVSGLPAVCGRTDVVTAGGGDADVHDTRLSAQAFAQPHARVGVGAVVALPPHVPRHAVQIQFRLEAGVGTASEHTWVAESGSIPVSL